jgi:glycosyltransferase involved in cell wall biosynthesis
VLAYRLVPEHRTAIVANGVHPACSPLPDPQADAQAAWLLGSLNPDRIELLHVGSTIPRKRVDLLLRVFGSLRRSFPNAHLVQAGGKLTAPQEELVHALQLDGSVSVLPFVNPGVLAAVYRRAALLLVTSETEGFGLPVIEAMACGTPVIATDHPSLREAGGRAADYCPNDDVGAWTTAVAHLINERSTRPERWSVRKMMGVKQAANFNWADNAEKTAKLYKQLVA